MFQKGCCDFLRFEIFTGELLPRSFVTVCRSSLLHQKYNKCSRSYLMQPWGKQKQSTLNLLKCQLFYSFSYTPPQPLPQLFMSGCMTVRQPPTNNKLPVINTWTWSASLSQSGNGGKLESVEDTRSSWPGREISGSRPWVAQLSPSLMQGNTWETTPRSEHCASCVEPFRESLESCVGFSWSNFCFFVGISDSSLLLLLFEKVLSFRLDFTLMRLSQHSLFCSARDCMKRADTVLLSWSGDINNTKHD